MCKTRKCGSGIQRGKVCVDDVDKLEAEVAELLPLYDHYMAGTSVELVEPRVNFVAQNGSLYAILYKGYIFGPDGCLIANMNVYEPNDPPIDPNTPWGEQGFYDREEMESYLHNPRH